MPANRGRYLTASELAYVRLVLDLHAAADCDLPDCPVNWLAGFLTALEHDLAAIGDTARTQLWASIFTIRALAAGPDAYRVSSRSRA